MRYLGDQEHASEALVDEILSDLDRSEAKTDRLADKLLQGIFGHR